MRKVLFLAILSFFAYRLYPAQEPAPQEPAPFDNYKTLFEEITGIKKEDFQNKSEEERKQLFEEKVKTNAGIYEEQKLKKLKEEIKTKELAKGAGSFNVLYKTNVKDIMSENAGFAIVHYTDADGLANKVSSIEKLTKHSTVDRKYFKDINLSIDNPDNITAISQRSARISIEKEAYCDLITVHVTDITKMSEAIESVILTSLLIDNQNLFLTYINSDNIEHKKSFLEAIKNNQEVIRKKNMNITLILEEESDELTKKFAEGFETEPEKTETKAEKPEPKEESQEEEPAETEKQEEPKQEPKIEETKDTLKKDPVTGEYYKYNPRLEKIKTAIEKEKQKEEEKFTTKVKTKIKSFISSVTSGAKKIFSKIGNYLSRLFDFWTL